MATFRHAGTIHKLRARFIDGMVARGYERDFAERCFRQIEGFGDYGFPESHAASFALLVYVSAWLKCHYPAVFACAILNSQPMGFYAPAQLVRDARDHGVEVRPVDVNHSEWDCTLERTVRLPARSRSGFASAEAGRESFEHLAEFVRGVVDAGADALIVHARIAVLGGLSPKENRTIPPLRYDVVYRLKDTFPDLPMVINGGFADADAAVAQLARVDGAMIGRAAYDNPMLLSELESRVFGGPRANREAVLAAYADYAERADAPVRTLARPLMGLYAGMPGARAFRRALGDAACTDDLRFAAAHRDRNLVLAA